MSQFITQLKSLDNSELIPDYVITDTRQILIDTKD